ncbi:helix-turn-helix domain-containing protein [Haloparvum sp. PAK95]|uniref:helix-turn-helix domain-containing protein n=1 Tax=Haloparvum sp. PAK95 TaxID=3418962 RepID=UPI003D2F131D
MPQATLSLSPPDGTPLRDVGSRTDATLHVVGASLGSAPPALLVSCRGSGASDAAERLCEHEATQAAATLRESADEALVHCRGPSPSLAAVADAGVAFQPPLVVRGARAELKVRTTDDGLSALRRTLEASAVAFEVRSVHANLESPRLLSDRQERVLRTAVEAGYYAVPQDTTVEAVADDLDLAVSTVSETLARAERQLAGRYLRTRGERSAGDDDPDPSG